MFIFVMWSSLWLPPYSTRNLVEWVTKKTTKTTLGFFVERGMRNERGMDARNSPRVTCDTSHISAMQNCKHNHLRQYGGHLTAFFREACDRGMWHQIMWPGYDKGSVVGAIYSIWGSSDSIFQGCLWQGHMTSDHVTWIWQEGCSGLHMQ